MAIFVLMAVAATSAEGCTGEGAAIEAKPQIITFLPIPPPPLEQGTQTRASATASSGLPVRYSSLTPTVCSVDGATGLVMGARPGTCVIAANQSGDTHYAPAAQVTQAVSIGISEATLVFADVPSLYVFDRATVAAVHSLGTPVTYETITPLVCSVDRGTGLVHALSPGDCTVIASAGASQAAQTLAVAKPAGGPTVPGAPTSVVVSAGDNAARVVVEIGGTFAGGAPLGEYVVSSSPSGITASAPTSPVRVECPSTCAGLGFSVRASNAVGPGPWSPWVDVITRYDVTATFFEPDTQPNDSLFVGAFTLDATLGEVSNLRGVLSESMTGGATPYPNDTMTWLQLDHQLSSIATIIDGARGVLVTTFRLPITATLAISPASADGDGWSPGAGTGLYAGYPGENPGNAYVRIFVNLANPCAVPTQAQIDKLAYADCAPGGMMGATCMTGTAVAGYGRPGTMSGYPMAETVVKR